MNANLYLERIGISPAEVAHTYAFLKKLQESHICTVPYENLDILTTKPLTYQKMLFLKRSSPTIAADFALSLAVPLLCFCAHLDLRPNATLVAF